MRVFFKKVSILENNLVQTIASVGEALAAGVIFTVPALYLLGDHPAPSRIFLLSALGGILGVLFMIPMRRYLIVQEHRVLLFPEGTACAEILKSGEGSRSKARFALVGILVGAFHKFCSSALYLWNEVPSWAISLFQRTEFKMDCTPALLGVGYIIGTRISVILFAGGALAWWVLIPLIEMFGGSSTIYPAEIPISQMSPDDIWSNYIRYIGAGTVAIGGIMSLIKISPLIGKTLKIGFSELFQGSRPKGTQLRTDKDISLRWLILGSLAILIFLWLFPGLPLNFVTIALLILLGFFFVAVTSLTTGIIGSTSNPVSGMIITTLLITCLIFILIGWTERMYLIAALTMGVVANVAICMAGTTSQDLKTGFLLGATPRLQQIGEIIGVIIPALLIAGTMYLLNQVYGFGSNALPAPQATMLALITKGVMQGNIPTTLLIVGIILGLLVECLRLPILPFAIGLYLPLSLSTAIVIGGIAAGLVKYFSKKEDTSQTGILAASGLVAGDACMGVVIALLTFAKWVSPEGKGFFSDWVSMLIYLIIAAALWLVATKPRLFAKKN